MLCQKITWNINSNKYQKTTTSSVSVRLKGLENPSIRNLDDRKVSSSFASVRTTISILFVRSFNWWNLPGREFIFKQPTMILFVLFNLSSLSSYLWYIIILLIFYWSSIVFPDKVPLVSLNSHYNLPSFVKLHLNHL